MPSGAPASRHSLSRRLFWAFWVIGLAPLLAASIWAWASWGDALRRIMPFERPNILPVLVGLALLTGGAAWLAAREFTRRYAEWVKSPAPAPVVKEKLPEFGDRYMNRLVDQLVSTPGGVPDLLQSALDSLARHFGCTFGAAYLIDAGTQSAAAYAELAAAVGSLSEAPQAVINRYAQKRINLDSTPTLDWRIGQAVATRRPLSGEVQGSSKIFEAVLPLVQPAPDGPQVIGVLDLLADSEKLNTRLSRFPAHIIGEMQTAASVIAMALASRSAEAGLVHSEEAGGGEGDPDQKRSLQLDPAVINAACSRIARAETQADILAAMRAALRTVPFTSAVMFKPEDSPAGRRAPVEVCRRLNIYGRSPNENTEPLAEIDWDVTEAFFVVNSAQPLLLYDLEPGKEVLRASDAPACLLAAVQQLGCRSAAFLPCFLPEFRGENGSDAPALQALLLIGASPSVPAPLFRPDTLDTFAGLVELAALALQRIRAQRGTQRRLAELETLADFTSSISSETDFTALLRLLHTRIEAVMGSINSFAVGLYAADTNLVTIPYMVESGQTLDIPAFPLGAGLSSAVIHSRAPLVLSSAAEVQAESERLGAYQIGEPARSWLGVPMLFAGEVVGLIIVQDTEQERRFTAEDAHVLEALAAQVAVVVRNVALIEDSRRSAETQRRAAEIAGRLWSSTSVDAILRTALKELSVSLGARDGWIELRPVQTAAQPAGNGNGLYPGTEEAGDAA